MEHTGVALLLPGQAAHGDDCPGEEEALRLALQGHQDVTSSGRGGRCRAVANEDSLSTLEKSLFWETRGSG